MTIWTSLADETQLVEDLVATGRVAADVTGESVAERDLQLLRVGTPPPSATDRATLFLLGLQHGNEPAGREGLLRFTRDLAYAGPYLSLTGTAGDNCTTPDAATLDISRDLDIAIDMLLDDWTPGAITYIFSKFDFTGNDRSWALRLGSDDGLELLVSSNGTGVTTNDATAAIPVADGQRIALRAVVEWNDDDDSYVVRFYTAPSIVSGDWTQLGDEVGPVTPANPSIWNSSAELSIGGAHNDSGNHAGPGRVFAAYVKNGIDGTAAADPDFEGEALADTSFADAAGRTWTVNGSAAIASTLDQDHLDFLANHGLLVMPTANPDGFANGMRTNDNSVDINRTHIDLSQPESQAIATVMAATRPLLTVDHHEAFPQSSTNITFAQPKLDQTHADIENASLAVITAMKARATSESWSNGDYGDVDGSGNERVFISNAGIRNSCSVLIETSRNLDTDPDQEERTDWHYAMAEEALAYVVANRATLLADVDAAIADGAAEGAAGTDPFDLRVATLDPPPLGYRIAGIPPSLYLNAFNITVANGIITMAQDAQPVIPFLFDPQAQYRIATATPLFTLPTPAVVATVTELAPIVSGSHRMVAEALVLSTFQSSENPDGTEIRIADGDVRFDATAEIFATLELTTPGLDENRRPLFPRRAADLLAPYGREIFVRRGVDLGDQILWSPLGIFRIDAVEQDGDSDTPIRISGSDRMSGVIDGTLLEPIQFGRSRTIGDVVTELVTPVHPAAVILFDDDSDAKLLGRQMVVEESRHAALKDIADSLGKIVYWDGAGVLRITDAPDPDEILWDVKAGRSGVLLTSGRRVSREGMANAVVATGEGASESPVRGVAVDLGVNSPTRWTPPDDPDQQWFGQVPRPYSSPLLTTNAQAKMAAESLLRRYIGLPYSADFSAVPNPALRPYDVIRVTAKDGSRDTHISEMVTVPLVSERAMTGTTREQTSISIGEPA